MPEQNKQVVLPSSVISPTDIARMVRELGNLDEFFRQSEIRQGGAPQSAPRYSRLLDELVVANGLNLLQVENRQLLLGTLKELQLNAPVLHISFSADPPGSYVQKIVGWLRQNIDGLILVRVGLQPNIGAGCIVRTTNKSFDFSLRKYFESKHDFFMKKLHEVISPELQDETPDAPPPQQAAVATEKPVEKVETPAELPEAPIAPEAPEAPETEAPSPQTIEVQAA